MSAIEIYLLQTINTAFPYASTGVLVAACIVALSRLPLLNIAALAAACVSLGAILSTGGGQIEAGMQMVAAGVVSAGILLLSGGQLWRRPSLGIRAHLSPILRGRGGAPAAPPDALPNLPPVLGGRGGAPAAPPDALPNLPPVEPAPLHRALGGWGGDGDRDDDNAIAATLLFRLASVAVLALAASALAPVIPLNVAADDMRLALWLAGMGLFAAFSSGSAIVSATGYVMAISAVTLLIPTFIPDITQQPMAYAMIPVIMILAALAFSFVAVLHTDGQRA